MQDDLEINGSTDPVLLCDADAAALDAVLSGEAPGARADPAREQVLRGVLGVLEFDREGGDTGDDPGEALVAATLARIAAARRDAAPREPVAITPLCEADGEALDVALDHRRRGLSPGAGPVPAGSRERVERVAAVLNLLQRLHELGPDEADATRDGDLVARTMQAVADARQRERFAQQVQMFADPPRTLGLSWRQVATAAAVFLLGISVLMPVLDRSRADAQRAACSANLAAAGMGFSAYAADHDDALPRGPVRPGDPWTHVGRPSAVSPEGFYRSNSAHLYLLIRLGYLPPEELACASNDAAGGGTAPVALGRIDWSTPQAVSYSYQNQYTPGRSAWP